MDRKRFTLEIPWPNFSKIRLARLLPTPGNVIFTLVMIGLLVAAQTAGALPLPAALRAPAAASTGTIAYQGRLADAAGAPLTGTYNMIFRLYDAATGGAPLWSEQWTGSNGVRVSDGLFNVMLGSLTALPQAVIAGHDQLFLGITVGTDDEMAPRVQLGSVPFAVQALTVPDGSVTTAKIADKAVTQAKAPSLLASAKGENVKVYYGVEQITVTGTQTMLNKTVAVTPACSNMVHVWIQPHYNYHSGGTATVGLPWDGSKFTAFFRLLEGASWGDGQVQSFGWVALCW